MQLIGSSLEIPPSVLAALDRRLDPTLPSPVTVAFSGGGDSLLLLLAACAWARRCGRPVLALHVDHRFQPESGSWAEAARRVAEQLGARFHLLVREGEAPKTGLPAAARSARLRLMADAAREAGARALLIGHTRDDAREADWMRRHGSTLGGLSEWSPSPVWPEGREIFHLRPLLGLGRAEIRCRLSQAGWAWIDDPANLDLRHARARARAALAADTHVSEDPRPYQGLPPDLAHPAVSRFGVITQTRGALARHPHAISASMACAGGGDRPVRSNSPARLSDRLRGSDRFIATLAGARMEADGDHVLICRDAGDYARRGEPRLHLAEGQSSVWDGRFEVTAGSEPVTLAPLKGRAARLSETERARLRALPPTVRPTLPALVSDSGEVVCPLLAGEGRVRVRELVSGRLAAALGLIPSEAGAVSATHGEGARSVLCCPA